MNIISAKRARNIVALRQYHDIQETIIKINEIILEACNEEKFSCILSKEIFGIFEGNSQTSTSDKQKQIITYLELMGYKTRVKLFEYDSKLELRLVVLWWEKND